MTNVEGSCGIEDPFSFSSVTNDAREKRKISQIERKKCEAGRIGRVTAGVYPPPDDAESNNQKQISEIIVEKVFCSESTTRVLAEGLAIRECQRVWRKNENLLWIEWGLVGQFLTQVWVSNGAVRYQEFS